MQIMKDIMPINVTVYIHKILTSLEEPPSATQTCTRPHHPEEDASLLAILIR